MHERLQRGFTLLEIVIVVLIVGMVLAGVLKGQEMITSAKVKRLSGQMDEIRTAFLGFEDRYLALPGDYANALAALDCGGSVCLHGNGDDRIRASEAPVNGSQVREDILVWTHLTRSGLLKGDYNMADGASASSDQNTAKNPYSAYMQIAFDGVYGVGGASMPRHTLKTGPQVPVEVLAELDRKTDDGRPYHGAVQFSPFAADGAPAPGEEGAQCTTAATPDGAWNVAAGSTNCGAALLL
jgi:prepilin-type N-terminal cleavage/methylation domain-containing protein